MNKNSVLLIPFDIFLIIILQWSRRNVLLNWMDDKQFIIHSINAISPKMWFDVVVGKKFRRCYLSYGSHTVKYTMAFVQKSTDLKNIFALNLHRCYHHNVLAAITKFHRNNRFWLYCPVLSTIPWHERNQVEWEPREHAWWRSLAQVLRYEHILGMSIATKLVSRTALSFVNHLD